MTALQADLLRQIADPRSTCSIDAKLGAAEKLLVDDAGLPLQVVEALSSFFDDPSRTVDVQLAVVGARMWDIGAECFAEVVAYLALTSRLAVAQAAGALGAIPVGQRAGLSSEASHAIDVADAVVEDASDGLMKVEDDDLLREALVPLAERAQSHSPN